MVRRLFAILGLLAFVGIVWLPLFAGEKTEEDDETGCDCDEADDDVNLSKECQAHAEDHFCFLFFFSRAVR